MVGIFHMLSFVCIARERRCDQHRVNQNWSDSGQGFCILEQKENSSYRI
ncbi:unnamed protein product [Staurois parvus]|uniref:Uncharacterized protein n=1 Tax=Staurois parvus TaxID=386267 RepID=A0ABN9HAV6_9NEOB|nr:unnamed protein product [Staurois parvus]